MEYYREEVRHLKEALENSWSKNTSSEPENWDEYNPSYGQSDITAAVVQDYLGGRIEWKKILVEDNKGYEDYFESGEKVCHYHNRVDGHNIFLAREQFPESHAVLFIPEEYGEIKEVSENIRDYILSSEEALERYEQLRKQVGKYLELGEQVELT